MSPPARRSQRGRAATCLITPFGPKAPDIRVGAFVDVSVRIIGAVTIEPGASIWPMSVLRADSSSIRIGRKAVVLDLALLEAPEGFPIDIGDGALVSHGSIIHGATIAAGSLIGMGAIILDGALISTGSIVGAGSVVTAGTVIPPDSLVLGSPGKVVRPTTPDERARLELQVLDLYAKSRLYLDIPGSLP